MKTITLDRIVRNACANVGDIDASRAYAPMMRFAVMATTDLGFNVFPRIKTAMAQVDENLSIAVPKDCLRPITAFKRVSNHCVYPLTETKHPAFRPDDMIPPKPWACPVEAETSDTVCYDLPNINNESWTFWYQNWYYGEDYGYSESRFFGIWGWEPESGKMFFEDNWCIHPGDQVVFTYETDVEECLVVPQDAEMMVFHFVLHIYFSSTQPQKSTLQLNYFKIHKRNYDNRQRPFNRQDILDALSRGYKSAPR